MNQSDFTILVVEDEVSLARGLTYNLQAEGYKVILADDGRQALSLVEQGGFDLVVLDLILPHVSGYDILKEIRGLYPRLPVLILTARIEETDRVRGLKLGADDYMVKPFHLEELLLRIQGMIRRLSWYAEPDDLSEEYKFGDNWVNFTTMQAQGPAGERILTTKEARLLKVLIDNEGQALRRDHLLQEVWGYPSGVVTRTLDTFIARLRSYFEPNPRKPVHILSLRGLGYRFIKNPK